MSLAKYITDIDLITQIPEERAKLREITNKLFKVNDYYLGLINWEDPDEVVYVNDMQDVPEPRSSCKYKEIIN